MNSAPNRMLPAGFVALLGCLALASPVALARSVTVIPKTTHSALTMSTDGTYGFQVHPGRPLNLDLVGPGQLTLTVRLNNTRKRNTFQGQVEFRRNDKRIKRSNLKLYRSRVGFYNEDHNLHPSMPKIFKIKVPDGLQNYTFSLRAKRGVSMTIGLEYASDADQSAAQASDDLALVPLVPPGDADMPPDDIGLVPLAPIEPAPSQPTEAKPPVHPALVAKIEAPKPNEKPKEPSRSEPGGRVDQPQPPVTKPEPKVAMLPLPNPKPAGTGAPRKVETLEPRGTRPTDIGKQAPPTRPRAPFLSIGVKAGEISPLQNIGSASFTVGLDLRYVLPVFEGRLSLGVEAGYHQFAASLGYENSTTRTTVDLKVVPISLQIFYRIPLGTFLQPFVGASGDLLIGFGEVATADAPGTTRSGSGLGFGGHVSAGLEAALGPGYLLLEVRIGLSKMDLGVVDNLDAAGLAVVAGYRFEI